MRLLFSILSLCLIQSINAQSSTGSFEAMVDDLLKFSVPTMTVEQLCQEGEVVLLDARSIKEYEVSHIEGAKFVGYRNFDISILENYPAHSKIVVYCSVGYRSEKIGKKIQAAGFNDVHNLYGGIFDWVNRGYDVHNEKGVTNKIHPYNKNWGKWLNRGEKSY